jgi:hypothetical protein
MILSWTYFLILQALVLVTFYLKRNDKEDFVLSKLFSTKLHFLIINICMFFACYFYNTERQIFCRPVTWAATVIILFCISYLVLPFLTSQSKLINLVSPICGLGFFISLYVLLFALLEYLTFAAFNIPIILILHFVLRFIKRKFQTNIFDAFYFYPVIILTPFILLFQLWTLLKSLQTNQKRSFIATSVLTLVVTLMLTFQINIIIHRISAATNKEKELKEIIANPINNYLTELILGAHWKYHTEMCLYDGWRPPFHDPVLVIANKVLFPFSLFGQGTDLQNAVELYKKLYPNNPTKFDCKCASHERIFDL